MIEVVAVILGATSVVFSLTYLGYALGKNEGEQELTHAQLKLKATQAVQHNLNCLIGDLRHEVK